ncbi:MAG: hypothetical protein ACK5JD_10135 [Mangrovibacterium sp.]
MRKIFPAILLLFSLLSNCVVSKSIVGSWYYLIGDKYTEIYISDSLITECDNKLMGLSPSYHYNFENDTIFVYNPNGDTNGISVKIKNNKNIELFYKNQWIHCERLSDIEDIYTIGNQEQEKYDEFLFNFNLRAEKAISSMKAVTPR